MRSELLWRTTPSETAQVIFVPDGHHVRLAAVAFTWSGGATFGNFESATVQVLSPQFQLYNANLCLNAAAGTAAFCVGYAQDPILQIQTVVATGVTTNSFTPRQGGSLPDVWFRVPNITFQMRVGNIAVLANISYGYEFTDEFCLPYGKAR